MRFQNDRSTSSAKSLLISAGVFIVLVGAFYFGVSSLSTHADKEQEQALYQAITQSVTHCYAIEGTYPESLDYLKKYYGITYDSNKFFVDYQPIGSNLLPDVTVFSK